MNLDDVRMRLDIMLSQSDLIKEGDLGRYIESNIAHRELAVTLENILSYLDDNLEKMNRPALRGVSEKCIPGCTTWASFIRRIKQRCKLD